MTSGLAAEKAHHILKIVAERMEVREFYNLGIRFIFHAVVPDGDSRSLLLHRVMGKTDPELEPLESGGGLLGGVKFFVNHADGGRYTLLIEPLFADQRFLYLDLDAQFSGSISERSSEV